MTKHPPGINISGCDDNDFSKMNFAILNHNSPSSQKSIKTSEVLASPKPTSTQAIDPLLMNPNFLSMQSLNPESYVSQSNDKKSQQASGTIPKTLGKKYNQHNKNHKSSRNLNIHNFQTLPNGHLKMPNYTPIPIMQNGINQVFPKTPFNLHSLDKFN